MQSDANYFLSIVKRFAEFIREIRAHTYTHTYAYTHALRFALFIREFLLTLCTHTQRRFAKSFHVTHTCWTLLCNYFYWIIVTMYRGSLARILKRLFLISPGIMRGFSRLKEFDHGRFIREYTRSCIYILQHTKSYPYYNIFDVSTRRYAFENVKILISLIRLRSLNMRYIPSHDILIHVSQNITQFISNIFISQHKD